MSRPNFLQVSCAGLFAVIGFFTIAQSAVGQQARLYYFTAQNCPPCKQMMPVVDRLARQGFAVTKIDVETQPKWAKHFDVSATPTCIIVADNTIYGRSSGILSVDRLKRAMVETERLAKSARQKKSKSPGSQYASHNRNSGSTTNVRTQPSNQNSSVQTPAQSNSASPKQIAYQATVRLRVEDPEGISHGTGTIIDVRDGHALVLTCGHIFRESAGKGEIMVDYGFDQKNVKRSRGRLLQCDWDEKDVALVTMSIERKIQPVLLAPASQQFRRGESAFSVGCSHGKPPTVKDCQIKRVAMYGLANSNSNVKAKKIDTTVKPVDGRSGGGLFAADGRLIGVCNAAATEVDEGIYSAMENVFWQLKQARLTHITGASPQRLASNRSQNTSSTTGLKQPQKKVWTIQAKSPDGRVYTINNPSPELMQRIASESQVNGSDSRMRPGDMPAVRQSRLPAVNQYRAQSPR